MKLDPLPFDATVADAERRATDLLSAWQAGDHDALALVAAQLPRYRDPEYAWLARPVPDEELRATPLTLDDARLAIARAHDFLDWAALVELAEAVARDAEVARFERAVEAVVAGDEARLGLMLEADPALVRARSTRRAPFDPPGHEATLLHYVAANGVEHTRQRTPANAVAVAWRLLDGGADPNATARMYGGRPATMSMLVSSDHPARAGVQVPLIDVLVAHGASVEAVSDGPWASPLMTALVFAHRDAAAALVRHGARVDRLAAAAGLGRVDDARAHLDGADAGERHAALALAAQNGHAEVVALLLDAGEDPSRFNPPGFHSHSTPLHQAALAGHDAVVRALVEGGARLDVADRIWHGTPIGWADYGHRPAIVEYLRSKSR
ncbi:MAG: ankyrin repeat domain-containing protein [Vicinamibacterales bacterium]